MKIAGLSGAALLLGVLAGYLSNRAEFAGVVESHFDPAASRIDQNAPAAHGPRVQVVNGEAHNFGTMDQHTRGEHVFVMKNVGDSPLYIEKGDTTCKCTVSELEDGAIPPGGSVDITLSWEVTDPPEGSEFRQIARFRTNDPHRPLIELLIHGYVNRSIRAIPEELVLKRLSANEPTTAELRLYAYQQDEFDVRTVELAGEETREFFDIEFTPMTAAEVAAEQRAKAGLIGKVTIQPGLPLGALRQTLRISTTLPDHSEVEVPIRGTVTSDISLVGRNFREELNLLDLRTVRQSEGATAQLHILVKGPYRDDVELEVATTEPSDVLRATVGPADRGNPKIVRYPLKIEIPPGARQASHLSFNADQAGKILLKTTHPQAKEIQLLVRFAVEG